MGRLQRRLGPNGLGELREMRFEFSFNLIGKLTMDFLKAYHSAYSNRDTQAGPRTRISALSRRRTYLECSIICSAGYLFLNFFKKISYYLLILTYVRYKTNCLKLVWLKHISLAARLIRSSTQIGLVTRHQNGTSALVSLTLFRVETSGYVAKSQRFQATPSSLSVG